MDLDLKQLMDPGDTGKCLSPEDLADWQIASRNLEQAQTIEHYERLRITRRYQLAPGQGWTSDGRIVWMEAGEGREAGGEEGGGDDNDCAPG